MTLQPSSKYFDVPPEESIVQCFSIKKWITILNGQEGSGKSTLMYALCRSVSTGTPFLGLPTTRCPIIYSNVDNMPPTAIRKRFDELSGDNNIDWWDNVFWTQDAINFNNIQQTEKMVEEWSSVNPGLIIFDTLAGISSGSGSDENSSNDMTLIMSRFRHIIKTLNCGIILLHHVPKAALKGKSVSFHGRGSTAIAAGCDMEFNLIGQIIDSISITRKKSRSHQVAVYPIKIDGKGFSLQSSDISTEKPLGAWKGIISSQQRENSMDKDDKEIAIQLFVRFAEIQTDDSVVMLDSDISFLPAWNSSDPAENRRRKNLAYRELGMKLTDGKWISTDPDIYIKVKEWQKRV